VRIVEIGKRDIVPAGAHGIAGIVEKAVVAGLGAADDGNAPRRRGTGFSETAQASGDNETLAKGSPDRPRPVKPGAIIVSRGAVARHHRRGVAISDHDLSSLFMFLICSMWL